LSEFDQNFNRFLAVENTIVAVFGQKLSEAILENQQVKPLSLSYTRRPEASTLTPRAPQQRRQGGGVGWHQVSKKQAAEKRSKGLAGVGQPKIFPY
jgi:hypothetical protein